jgi:lambda family phage portal protein
MWQRIKKAARALAPVVGGESDRRKTSVTAYGDSKWNAASLDKELRRWTPGVDSADSALFGEAETIEGRALDLDRNEPLARSGIDTVTDNVVDSGLDLRPIPDWRALGKSPEWAEEWSLQVESEWRTWWHSTDCHAGRTLTGPGMTRLVFREVFARGNALALPVFLPDSRMSPYGTALHLIDSARLSNPNGKTNTATLRDGIEIDKYGAPVAYHIQKAHPADALFDATVDQWTWERIPAFTDWGRRRVLHIYRPDRVGQSRGVSRLASIIAELKGVGTYRLAEIQAAVANALVAAFIETPIDIAGIKEMFGGDEGAYERFLSARAEHVVKLKMGAVLPLFPGEKMSSFATSRPNAAFGAFIEAALWHVCAGFGIPRELLLKDFTRTTYSSARAAMLEAWRTFTSLRDWLSAAWHSPCYLLWLEEAVETGRVEAPGFYDKWAAYSRARWIGRGMSIIDMEKESSADIANIAAGLDTYEDVLARRGKDWRQVLEQRAREITFVKSLGVPELTPVPQASAPKQQPAPVEEKLPETMTNAA